MAEYATGSALAEVEFAPQEADSMRYAAGFTILLRPAPLVPESSKAFVWEAFQRVKANGGSVGVDGESIEEFGTESSFSSLKRERSRKHIYKNRDPATKDVADKSENFLNRVRRRSHVGGVSPEQFASAQKSR